MVYRLEYCTPTNQIKMRNIMYFILTLFMMIGCGVHKHAPAVSIAPDVVITITPSTPTPQQVPDTTIKPPTLQQEVKALAVQTEKAGDNPYQKLNLRWQEVTLRAIDSTRARKKDKDAALEMMRAMRDTMDSRYAREQAKKVQIKQQEKVTKETFNMFNIILLGCLTICTLHALIELIKWILLKVRKPISV